MVQLWFTRKAAASNASHGRQLQAMVYTAASCKQRFTRQAAASNVSHGRQLQAMFHTAGSCRQCFTRQAVASNELSFAGLTKKHTALKLKKQLSETFACYQLQHLLNTC